MIDDSLSSFLFVCTGNICRSPTAEGVFRTKLRKAGLVDLIDIDSAGTHGYHVGEAPDSRACEVALSRGYDLSKLRARQIEPVDFSTFDAILFMDRSNESMLRQRCPTLFRNRLYYLMDFARLGKIEVPDPYYGDREDFETTLSMIESACDRIVDALTSIDR